MSGAALGFYKFVRRDDKMVNMFKNISDEALFIKTAVELGHKHGYIFSTDEAATALAQFDSFIEAASNDDELTDFELEMVAAGIPINGNSGVTHMQ
mgnify:CR=1 FL=1|tara:strand:- start:23880 stop:24167 length:288 start_codon:yes stop_codon:yes gene_type:complete